MKTATVALVGAGFATGRDGIILATVEVGRIIERTQLVKFAIEIGEREKHRLEYNFSQLLGRVVIKVNDKPVKQSVRWLNEPILEVFAFPLGDQERTEVRIEKRRKALVGCRNRLYVNNRLVRVFDGA